MKNFFIYGLAAIAFILVSCETDDKKEAIEEPGPPPSERDLNLGDDILDDLEMGDEDVSENQIEVKKRREEKNYFFKNSPDSPIPKSIRSRFGELEYYPFDKNYVIKTELNKFERPDTVSLMTSTGKLRTMIRYGIFNFQLNGRDASLTAYVAPEDVNDPDRLFIPFEDMTTGKETYLSGRYLDLQKSSGNIYIIDFNQAYNPYCAYHERYSCPLVPEENKLKEIAIRAGEKNYK